jgi:hypothetical protein
LEPHVYELEIRAARRLIEMNDNHRGIHIGRKWLQKMMDSGSRGSAADIQAALYWGNLCKQKVSPNDLLIRLSGLWLFERYDHIRWYIKNDKHMTILTGHAVVRFGLICGMKCVQPDIYLQVGDQVKEAIGPLLINLCWGAEKLEQRYREIHNIKLPNTHGYKWEI